MGGKHHVKCLVCGIKKDHFPQLHFFKLPQNNNRRMLWLNSLGRLDLIGVKIACDEKICERHFSDHMFSNKRKDRITLNYSAMPTQNKPEKQIRILDEIIFFPSVLKETARRANAKAYRFAEVPVINNIHAAPEELIIDDYITTENVMDNQEFEEYSSETTRRANAKAYRFEEAPVINNIHAAAEELIIDDYITTENVMDNQEFEEYSSGFRLEFDSDIQEEEKKFYTKVYPTVDLVCDRKVHCTVCDTHIGTAPAQESTIRMHPVLRVTHCKKCHDFYNSGEFSKGEDGSELYCRWCGQGGEVYCCSKCPFVFCKNCIVQNLSRGCVNDIEENESWNCFVCAPKIMWHLRAQHWALMNFIEKQKNSILSDEDLTDPEIRKLMTRDKSSCCKKRARSGTISESSCDSDFSISKKRREKKLRKLLPKIDHPRTESPEPKRVKLNNDEVVCTPDVLSMLARETSESDQAAQSAAPATPVAIQPAKVPTPPVKGTPISVPPKATATSPQILTIPIAPQLKPAQQRQAPQVHTQQVIPTVMQQDPQTQSPGAQINVQPPPLIIRNFSPQLRTGTPTVVTRKTVVGPRAPVTTPGTTPVYHTINGFRIDLNSAAQQETFRLPNGKLIQVKKQGTGGTPTTQPGNVPPNNTVNNAMNSVNAVSAMSTVTVNGQVMRTQLTPRGIASAAHAMVSQQPQTVQNFQVQSPQLATIRYAPGCGQVIPGTTTITATIPNGQGGTAVHLLNGTPVQQVQQLTSRPTPIPTLVRQFFSATPLGQARSQLQNQIFSAMEICQHLTGKIHTLTNSNAYKSVRNYTDVKELYIHLSYLFTYAIGRFKGLQDKCLEDMRRLGFAGDAASLESGQLEKHVEDGDEDEVEIVEPKTTCIDLDSDNDDSTPSATKSSLTPSARNSTLSSRNTTANQSLQPLPQIVNVQHLSVQQPQSSPSILVQGAPQQQIELAPPTTPTPQITASTPTTPSTPGSDLRRMSDCDFDVTANLLAGMLEVELTEGNPFFNTPVPEAVPKKPRKKTTNKPNPHLIKQQQMQERERIKEMIRRDPKLNSKCHVVLDRIECTMPEVKKMLEERKAGQIKTRTISLSIEAGEFNLKKDLSSNIAAEVTKEVKADTQSTDIKLKKDVLGDVPKITDKKLEEEIQKELEKPNTSSKDKNDEDISKEGNGNEKQKNDNGENDVSKDKVLEKIEEVNEKEAEQETEIKKKKSEEKKEEIETRKEQLKDEAEDTPKVMEIDDDLPAEVHEENDKNLEKHKKKKDAPSNEAEKSQTSAECDEEMKDVSSTAQNEINQCTIEEVNQGENSKNKGEENDNETEKVREEYLTVIEVVEALEAQEHPSSQNSQNSTSVNDTKDKGKEVSELHEEITAILENGFVENSQDSIKHSPITSGDSMDYLAAMDE